MNNSVNSFRVVLRGKRFVIRVLGLALCLCSAAICALLRYNLSLVPRRAFLLSCQKKQKALKVKGQ